jgi:hypothetical protein
MPTPEAINAVAPKDGVKTSSFKVFIATLLVGGLFTWLIRRGVSQDFLDAHRGEAIALLVQVLPLAYFGLIGFLGRVFMKYRERISLLKADALATLVKGKPRLTYRELALKVRDEDAILPILQKIHTTGEISPPEHLIALTRLAQEVGNNRRDIWILFLALSESGLLDLSPEDIAALHKTES